MENLKVRERYEYPFNYYEKVIKEINTCQEIIDFTWYCLSHFYIFADKKYKNDLSNIVQNVKNFLNNKSQNINLEELYLLHSYTNVSTLNYSKVPINISVVVSYSQLALALYYSIKFDLKQSDKEIVYLKSISCLHHIVSSDINYDLINEFEIKFINYLNKMLNKKIKE